MTRVHQREYMLNETDYDHLKRSINQLRNQGCVINVTAKLDKAQQLWACAVTTPVERNLYYVKQLLTAARKGERLPTVAELEFPQTEPVNTLPHAPGLLPEDKTGSL